MVLNWLPFRDGLPSFAIGFEVNLNGFTCRVLGRFNRIAVGHDGYDGRL